MRGEVTTFNHFRIKPVSVDTEERETTDRYCQSGQLAFEMKWRLCFSSFLLIVCFNMASIVLRLLWVLVGKFYFKVNTLLLLMMMDEAAL